MERLNADSSFKSVSIIICSIIGEALCIYLCAMGVAMAYPGLGYMGLWATAYGLYNILRVGFMYAYSVLVK